MSWSRKTSITRGLTWSLRRNTFANVATAVTQAVATVLTNKYKFLAFAFALLCLRGCLPFFKEGECRRE
jgi:hypothetical protein